MWILLIGVHVAVLGYPSEADCLAAMRKVALGYTTQCVPMPADGRVLMTTR